MTFAKQYKATSPMATVQRIKGLLSSAGIRVKEETLTLKGLVYSVRITITNGRIEGLGLGSNGKGVSPEYALASGYAELMERLQTRLLYDDMLMLPPSATKKFLGESFFRCAPEEVLRKADWSFFPKQGDGVDNLHVGRTAYANMLAVRTGKTEMVPLELMRYMAGSTGACAGNTREEAIVHEVHQGRPRRLLPSRPSHARHLRLRREARLQEHPRMARRGERTRKAHTYVRRPLRECRRGRRNLQVHPGATRRGHRGRCDA